MKNESIDNLSTKMQNLSIFTSLAESIDCKANDQTGAVLAGGAELLGRLLGSGHTN